MKKNSKNGETEEKKKLDELKPMMWIVENKIIYFHLFSL